MPGSGLAGCCVLRRDALGVTALVSRSSRARAVAGVAAAGLQCQSSCTFGSRFKKDKGVNRGRPTLSIRMVQTSEMRRAPARPKAQGLQSRGPSQSAGAHAVALIYQRVCSSAIPLASLLRHRHRLYLHLNPQVWAAQHFWHLAGRRKPHCCAPQDALHSGLLHLRLFRDILQSSLC